MSGEVAVSVRVDASLQDDGVRHGRKLVEGEFLLLTHWRLKEEAEISQKLRGICVFREQCDLRVNLCFVYYSTAQS